MLSCMANNFAFGSLLGMVEEDEDDVTGIVDVVTDVTGVVVDAGVVTVAVDASRSPHRFRLTRCGGGAAADSAAVAAIVAAGNDDGD